MRAASRARSGLPTCHRTREHDGIDTSFSRSPRAAAAACRPLGAGRRSQTVTVTGRSAAPTRQRSAGFGDVPLARAPLSGHRDRPPSSCRTPASRSLADITRLDAGISDAYNARGLLGPAAVRGFTLDNRFNYRRDGLPINAETAIAARTTRQRIEVLRAPAACRPAPARRAAW